MQYILLSVIYLLFSVSLSGCERIKLDFIFHNSYSVQRITDIQSITVATYPNHRDSMSRPNPEIIDLTSDPMFPVVKYIYYLKTDHLKLITDSLKSYLGDNQPHDTVVYPSMEVVVTLNSKRVWNSFLTTDSSIIRLENYILENFMVLADLGFYLKFNSPLIRNPDFEIIDID